MVLGFAFKCKNPLDFRNWTIPDICSYKYSAPTITCIHTHTLQILCIIFKFFFSFSFQDFDNFNHSPLSPSTMSNQENSLADYTTAILDRKKAANRFIVDEFTKHDNSLIELNPLAMNI